MDQADKKIIFPTVPEDLSSIVKPEELVDIIEMTPLTLQDRRIYNLLIGNAWNNVASQKKHTISHKELTKYIDSNNQDIKASFRRLMAAIVIIKIRNNKNGLPSTRQIQLLGTNEVEDRGGSIEYTFPDALIKVIRDTRIFARLHTKVMFELSSKYSLALYEFLQKRKNLNYVKSEKLPLDEARAILGVGKNKLRAFGHFNDKALKPALKEVSFLTEYEIKGEPIRTGRAVTHINFSWRKKSDIGSQIAAVEELERPRLGREARQEGQVEDLFTITSSQKGDSLMLKQEEPIANIINTLTSRPKLQVSESGIDNARKALHASGKHFDIYALEREFLDYAEKSGFAPDNVDGAFVGFVKKKFYS